MAKVITKTRMNDRIRRSAVDLAFERFEDLDLLKAEKAAVKKALAAVKCDCRKLPQSELRALERHKMLATVSAFHVDDFCIETDKGRDTLKMPMSLVGPTPYEHRSKWGIKMHGHNGSTSFPRSMPGAYDDTGLSMQATFYLDFGQAFAVPLNAATSHTLRLEGIGTEGKLRDTYGRDGGSGWAISDLAKQSVADMMYAGYERWKAKSEMMVSIQRLIGEAQTLEALIDFWPEAEALRPQVELDRKLPAQLIDVNVDVLIANMAARGVRQMAA